MNSSSNFSLEQEANQHPLSRVGESVERTCQQEWTFGVCLTRLVRTQDAHDWENIVLKNAAP